MTKEEFKPYPLDERIKVGNMGTIIGVYGRPVNGTMNRGYRFIGRIVNGKVYSDKVARVVAMTWVENPDKENYNTVNHINGNKADDRHFNLEWCTQSQNMIHAGRTGLLKFGSAHYLSKLDEGQVKVIRSGLLVLSNKQLAAYFRVNVGTIDKIRKGQSWKRVKGVPI